MSGRHGSFARGVQSRFGGLLLGSFVLGLVLPGVGDLPWFVVPGLLASVLFLACARITPGDVRAVSVRTVVGFYVLRFVAVPVLATVIARQVAPERALAVAVFCLLPAGVTTTAVVSILRGNPAIALAVTLLSTVLAPITLPLAVQFLGGTDLSPADIGVTLLGLILIPSLGFVVFARPYPRVVRMLEASGPPVSVLLICTIAFLVASSQRTLVLADPAGLLVLLAAGGMFYALLYGVGWGFSRGRGQRERVAWTLSSGNNNIVLGLTLALLHLTPADVVAFLAWDLAWIVGLSAIQPFVRETPSGLDPT